MEEKNKQLNDKNDALEKEHKDGVVNGENGVNDSPTDEAETIAELRQKIQELETVIEILRTENEAAKAASEKVEKETSGTTGNEEDQYLKEIVEELQAKIEVMQKEHESEVKKLKQELADVSHIKSNN